MLAIPFEVCLVGASIPARPRTIRMIVPTLVPMKIVNLIVSPRGSFILRAMFRLTRQEQLILAILMFALIVGSFVRLYRAADSSQKGTVFTSAPASEGRLP